MLTSLSPSHAMRQDPWRRFGPAVRELPVAADSPLSGLWQLEGGAGGVHYVAPDATTDVVLRVDPEGRIDGLVSAPTARFAVVPLSAGHVYVGARVRPGYAGALLSAHPQRSARAPLFRTAPLGFETAKLGNVGDVQRWLAARVSELASEPRSAPPSWVVETARLARHDRHVDVASMAKHVSVSLRTLHRGVLRWVGLAPKALMRVERARTAARLLAAGQPAADVWTLLHFSDQAHMIRELRAVLGFSPRELAESATLADFFKTVGP